MKRALMWLVGWALVGIVGGLIWHSVAKPDTLNCSSAIG